MVGRLPSLAELSSSARRLALTGLCFLFLWTVPAFAQPREFKEPLVDESFSIRQEEDLFQLEEILALLASSLSKISDRAKVLAINSMHFGRGVDADFRKKAEIIILEQLFEANPTIKLVQCQECQKLETKIVRGVLKLRKGLGSAEARIALAKKLGVDGFIDIGLFRNKQQITVFIKVVEAETGAIILVDELAGRTAFKRDAVTVSFGEMNFPIERSGTSVDYKALVIGVSESVQLTGRFSFSVALNLFTDNNTNNPDSFSQLESLDAGILLAPAVGFDLLRLQASTSRLIYYLGIGKLLAPQLDFANLFKTGFEFIVGDKLVITMGIVAFQETNIETATEISDATGNKDILSGSGFEVLFGYRF